MTNNDTSDVNSEDRSYNATSVSKGVSQDDKVLLRFGEQQFLGSIDTVKSFSQSMITLDSGLFAVYFALLEFLGVEDVMSQGIKISSTYVALPPILFIVSLISFVFAIMPLFTKLLLSFPDELSSVREKVLSIKYASAIAGVAFLLAAMAITIDVYLKILRF